MKPLNHYKLLFACTLALCINYVYAQESKPRLLIDASYHLIDNKYPFISVFTKAKIEKKFVPIPNITVKVYLGEETDAHLLGTIKTNKEGKAEVSFPVAVKAFWDTVSQFKLIATAIADKQYESATNEATVTKAKITFDTTNTDGTRNIVVTVKAKNGNEWKPVKDVETKVIVKRGVGNLSVGDAETYTTDSTGQVTVEFKKATLPGDAAGNITIVAKTEDNELYGSISTAQKLKWGAAFTPENTFNKRTLFATRGKAPLWLIFLATSIVCSVWFVIIYLAMQIFKIRKAGLHTVST